MQIGEISGRSEADVAAEFVHRIKRDGRLQVRMEVHLPSAHHRSGRFRVDAVVFRADGGVVCAVEFKRPGKRVGARTRQRNAYADLPFPHFYVIGFHGLKRVLPLVFAAAGLGEVGKPVDCFGKSAVSRTGRVKKSSMIGSL